MENGSIDFDKFRQEKLAKIEDYTKIPVVVYASDFLNGDKVKACQGEVDINHLDIQGFSEVTKNLPDGPLDIILHSPGGVPEATESIVKIIRQRFKPVRFFIPMIAKSAATMLALSGDEILMPPSSELGPIDPQFNLSDGAGGRVMTPAQALIDQFDQARAEIASNPNLAPAWAPVTARLSTGLYQMSKNAISLSKILVQSWLETYMFSGEVDASDKAKKIVDFLGDHNSFLTHGRRVDLDDLIPLNVKIKDIRKVDIKLWALVEEAWYSIQHTFEGTGAFKLFENSRKGCYVRVIQVVVQMAQPPTLPKR
jgi:hypothetical protein